MDDPMKLVVGILIFQSSLLAEVEAECSKDIYGAKNQFFVLSNNKANANTAQYTCATSGGSLIQIQDEDIKNDLLEIFNLKYTSDLITVKVWENPNLVWVKYRPSVHYKDPSKIESWNPPKFGQIVNFKLHNQRRSSEDLVAATFCYKKDEKRDIILSSTGNCWKDRNFLFNFELFHEGNHAEDTILLFLQEFIKEKGSTTRIFLSSDDIYNDLNSYKSSAGPSLRIPDISVIVGARSNVSETTWRLSDGREIVDTSYPTSNKSVCQQMSWPLTYDNGINLRPKSCAEDQSFYVCQFQFSVFVESVQCNGSSLRVTWNKVKMEEIITTVPDIKVQVVTVPESVQLVAPFNSFGMSLTGLRKRTNYALTFKLIGDGCSSLNVEVNSNKTTSYGLPDPVKRAYVVNNSASDEDCAIEWEYNPSDLNILTYEIFVNNSSDVAPIETVDREDFSKSNQMIRKVIDLSSFPLNTTLYFLIQAASCEGGGEIAQVAGSCTTPLKSNGNQPAYNTGIWIGIGIGLLCIMLVLGGIFYYLLTKTSSDKPANLSESTSTSFDKYNQAENTLTPTEDYQKIFTTRPELNNEHDKNACDYTDAVNMPSAPSKAALSDEVQTTSCIESVNITSTSRKMMLHDASSQPEKQNSHAAENLYENTQRSYLPHSCSAVIWSKDLEETYLAQCENGFSTFQDQFMAIKAYSKATKQGHHHSSKEENKKANRYKNIFPYDHARVVLDNGKYINASVIQGHENGRNYIATQGPKPNTIKTFWEMVWEQRVSVIVMLCKCVENGKSKCEQYWPKTNSSIEHGSFVIETLFEEKLGCIVKRGFRVKQLHGQDETTVIQFQYVSWPDHGVPITTSAILLLRRLVNLESQNKTAPLIVHCSAGAGRTGVFIAVDKSIAQLEATGKVDVMETITKMRENRTDMVQTKDQYIMVHKVVVEYFVLPETHFTKDELLKFLKQSSWREAAAKEYEKLSSKASSRSARILYDDNPYLNEAKSKPADINQVTFVSTKAGSQVVLDAHFIDNDYYPASIIASSEPARNMIEEFWEMIKLNNTRYVVALESRDNDEVISVEGEQVEMGENVITVVHVGEQEGYSQQSLIVSNKSGSKDPLPVTYILLRCWKEESVNINVLVDIIDNMKAFMKANDSSTALVYCKNGFSKTGLFFALANLIEEVECMGTVDVFRTVKDLKDMRGGIVDSADCYERCYDLARRYLQSKT